METTATMPNGKEYRSKESEDRVKMKYIGVKIVDASPMDSRRAREMKYRVDNVDLEDNVHGYEVTYPGGYKSWCPKDAFEEANRACDAMPFGHALEMVRKGFRVTRAGWSGKGMYILLEKIHTHTPLRSGMVMPPFISMKTADNTIVPWSASQADILVDDWMTVK